MLSNLIGKALKFNVAGGSIAVRVADVSEGLEISVKDSGAGIAEEDLAHIFDRFWQRDRTTRHGAGLGLANTKAIVRPGAPLTA